MTLISVEENKSLIHRFLDEGYNRQNLAIADELVSPDMVTSFFGAEFKGPEGWKKLATIFLSAFPDLQVIVDETLGEGDKVAARWTCHGTHKGPLRSIAATGKKVTWTGMAIYQVVGGKIVDAWGLNDALGLMQQLGVVPKTS